MAYQIKYEKSYAGAKLTATKSGASVFASFPSNGGRVYNAGKGDYVVLSGFAFYDGKYTNYLQTVNGMYVYINTLQGTENDWTITENYQAVPTYSDKQAQALINKICHNDSIIISNNLLCARYANKLTAAQRSDVRALQERLQARNNALQAEGLTTDIQTSYPAGYAELSAYLDKLMAGEAVGVAPIVWVIVAAVVVAGAGTAAYYTYKALADESEKDVQFSKELTKILTQKLTPEEYEQLRNETKGIVTKSRIKQMLSSYWDALTYAAIGVAGYFLYKLIKR